MKTVCLPEHELFVMDEKSLIYMYSNNYLTAIVTILYH